MSVGSEMARERRRVQWSRWLSPFVDVRVDELGPALLMAGQAFVLLTVYYLLKPVREAWILPGGAELKTYAAAAQAIGLVGVAQAHAHLARRLRRDRLIAISCAIAAGCLIGFHALSSTGLDLSIAFYLWLGAFQLILIAQFWSFATDLYTPEQGRRLFALLGVGAALGSVVGAQIARGAIRLLPDPRWLLLVAAATLMVAPILAWRVHRAKEQHRRGTDVPPPAVALPEPEPEPERAGLLGRVLGDPYLRLLAAFTLLLNWIATVGEYALDRALITSAADAVAQGHAASVGAYIAGFKADYYATINILVLVLQLFFVSRVLGWLGERGAIAVLPTFVVIGALGSLIAAGMGAPLLAVLTVERVMENGISHSIQSTARQSLYLVATRDGRWAGKAFIDTVTWRAGDVLGALTVALLAAASADIAHVMVTAIFLGACWIAVVRELGREHRARLVLAAR